MRPDISEALVEAIERLTKAVENVGHTLMGGFIVAGVFAGLFLFFK